MVGIPEPVAMNRDKHLPDELVPRRRNRAPLPRAKPGGTALNLNEPTDELESDLPPALTLHRR
jgi:hypothetical protein